jgi:hypothetical protein
MGFLPIGAVTLLASGVAGRSRPQTLVVGCHGVVAVSPAIVFLALEFIGKAIGTPAEPQPGSFGGALLLAESFLLIPWILICGAGFGIGFAIRTRLHKPPSEPSPRARNVTPQQPAIPPAVPIPISYPVQPVMEGVSTDGALRYEHRQGEFINGRYDSVSLCAVLIDAATGQTLVACAGWASSEITEQVDGSLFLHLRQNQFESLFRIDGRSGMFRDLGAGGDDKPLAALAQAVKTAWLATAPHASPPKYRHIHDPRGPGIGGMVELPLGQRAPRDRDCQWPDPARSMGNGLGHRRLLPGDRPRQA